MKYLSLLITYIFTANLLGSCEFENHLKPKKALITGYISNFDKCSNKNWIDFVAPDLFSMEFPRVPIEIKPDGSFRYELELVSPARCWGIYNKWFDFSHYTIWRKFLSNRIKFLRRFTIFLRIHM